MLTSKLLALTFSFAILGNAFVVRRIVGTWLFPAVLFAGFWFAYTILPLAGLFLVPVNPWSVAYILAATIAFSASALFYFDWKAALRANRAKSTPEEYFNTPVLRTVFAACALLSLPCFVLNMAAQGFSLSNLWSSMFETASTYAVMRYTETLTYSIFARLGIVLAYLAVTTGGLLFGSSRSRRQSALTLIGSFLPALAPMLFESAKGLFFFFIVLFFAGVLVTRIFRGELYVLDRKSLRNALLSVLVLVPLTMVSFLTRGLYALDDTADVTGGMVRYALTYAFGHLYAFSDWFSYRTGLESSLRYAPDATGFGFFTFTSVFRLAGSTRTLPIGIYDEIYEYGDILMTNIYTLFRGVIIDFGIPGGLLYMFASGFLIHLNFYFLLRKRAPVFAVVFFIYTLGYFYMSFALSMLTWNIVPAVAVGLAVALYLDRWSRLTTRAPRATTLEV